MCITEFSSPTENSQQSGQTSSISLKKIYFSVVDVCAVRSFL
uniref:Uncharacterized protein n=1 Tax=Anguilla anguilla TaxID=7936 RepID=A0A0E9W9A1_ANGAN